MTAETIAETKARALALARPFCRAAADEPCRTRNSGREQDWPHSRRIALAQPERKAPRVDALCCVCGERRTVSSDHARREDPNYSYDSINSHPSGWRSTQTLKCGECGEHTRHAVLTTLRDDRWRYRDEEQQQCALGCDAPNSSDEYVQRLRREYRQMPFPRNPNLRHRYWMTEAKAAWNEGSKKVVALCGERITLKMEPRKSTAERMDGYLIAEQFSDIEYEDYDTGLSWIDMDCVDCCRVSNAQHLAERRSWMEQLLAWFARRPEQIEDHEVEGVVDALARLAEVARQRNQSP
jgi:hypothetical protein